MHQQYGVKLPTLHVLTLRHLILLVVSHVAGPLQVHPRSISIFTVAESNAFFLREDCPDCTLNNSLRVTVRCVDRMKGLAGKLLETRGRKRLRWWRRWDRIILWC